MRVKGDICNGITVMRRSDCYLSVISDLFALTGPSDNQKGGGGFFSPLPFRTYASKKIQSSIFSTFGSYQII